MPEFDTVIRGGTIIDGLQTPRFNADIGIRDGRIASIGRISASDGARAIDASGLIVAPGFIDLHTHYDSQVYWDPYCTISGWHGVTSVVVGNCGFGFAPCKPEMRDRAMLSMERNEAVPLRCMQAGMPWDWETYPQFLDSLDKTPKGVNILSYVGLNPLMMYVMGLEAAKSRPATERERDEMCRLLAEAIDAGACGFSAQVLGTESVQRDYDGTPMITDTMSQDDLLAFAGVLAKLRKGFIQVAGGGLKLSEKVAEASGRPVIYNVLTITSDQHGATMEDFRIIMNWLRSANDRGLRIFGQAITCDIGFEFTLKDWNLFDTSRVWREVTLGTPDERLAKMANPEQRAALKQEYDSGRGPIAGGGNERHSRAGSAIAELIFEDIVDEDLKKRYDGLTIGEAAALDGKHPIDVMLDVAIADRLETTFVTPPRKQDMAAMKEMVNSPFAIPGVSDGGAHTKFLTLGAYPTEFLVNLVRDGGLMDLEQAHWRLSAYPALAAGFRDRGWIREGAPADILVYELDALGLGPQVKAYDFPEGEWRRVRKAEGYRWILVNGEVTFEDGVCSGDTPGRLLRHGVA